MIEPPLIRKISSFYTPKRLIIVLLSLWAFWFFIPPLNLYKIGNYPIKKTWDAKAQEVSYEFTQDSLKDWVPLKKISKNLVGAIITSEDGLFYQHHGIDLESTQQAIKDALRGKRIRGASTISQQLIKNLYLTAHKNMGRKIREAIYTLALELITDKNSILEAYLNIIEYGKGIYGIHRASYHYFKKHPSALSPKEGAFLAMLLPNPKLYSASFDRKTISPFANKVMKKILKRMTSYGYINQPDYSLAVNTPLSWEKIKPVITQTDFKEDQELKQLDEDFDRSNIFNPPPTLNTNTNEIE